MTLVCGRELEDFDANDYMLDSYDDYCEDDSDYDIVDDWQDWEAPYDVDEYHERLMMDDLYDNEIDKLIDEALDSLEDDDYEGGD